MGPFVTGSSPERLERAVVAIERADGVRLGSGTLVSRNGLVLTCHHVVAGLNKVRVTRPRTKGATGISAVVPVCADWLSKQFDLALLQTGWDEPDDPLPLHATQTISEWSAIGFQDISEDFAGVTGWVGGVTLRGDATLEHDTRYSVTSSGEEGLTYQLAASFHLHGYAVHPGTSGAGLVDVQTGCVVGVIVSSLLDDEDLTSPTGRSVAVPLFIALHWAPMKQLMEKNGATIPRFGAALNLQGAKLISQAQRYATIRSMFDDDELKRLRMRINAEDYLEQFLLSERLLLPLVGESGTGKSSLIAGLAVSHIVRCAFLLRGSWMERDDTSIVTLLERALAPAKDQGVLGEELDKWIDPAVPRPRITLFSEIAKENQQCLVFFLDAINECDSTRLSADRLATVWMPETTSWLREHEAKMVVSCRTETWQSFLTPKVERHVFTPEVKGAGADSLCGIIRRPNGGIWVGDFTDDERFGILEAYGINRDAINWEDARHPFFIFLLADSPGLSGSRIELIERALTKRTEEVARRTPNDSVGAAHIAEVIRELALALLLQGQQTLKRGRILSITRSPVIVNELINAGVLSNTPQGVRFRFDQYLESLQSEFVCPSTVDDRIRTWDAERISSPALRGVLAFAAERILLKTHSNNVYDEIIQSDLPDALRFELVIEIARLNEDGYGWRIKDWEEFAPEYRVRFKLGWHTKQVTTAVAAVSGQDWMCIAKLLLGHLNDERPLVGRSNREATVASLAGGCLTLFYKGRLAVLCGLLVEHWGKTSWSVMSVIAREEPSAFLNWALGNAALSKDGALGLQPARIIHHVAAAAAATSSPAERNRAIRALHESMRDSADPDGRAKAALSLRELDPQDNNAFDYVLERVVQAESDKSKAGWIHNLFPVPSPRTIEVANLLLACLKIPATQWDLWYNGLQDAVLTALARPEMLEVSLAEVMAILHTHIGVDEEIDARIADWIKSAMREKATRESEMAVLLQMARKCIDVGSLKAVNTFLDATLADFPEHCAATMPLISILAERSLTEASLAHAWMLMPGRGDGLSAEYFGRVLLLRRMNEVDWDNAAICALAHRTFWEFNDDIADSLIRMWRSLNKLTRGLRVRELLVALEAGHTLGETFKIACQRQLDGQESGGTDV